MWTILHILENGLKSSGFNRSFIHNTGLEINMALYLVRARPKKDLLETLYEELSSGKISKIGQALQYALEKIDIENTDFAL